MSWAARRLVESLAEVTFGDNFAFFIHLYGAVWANHDAGQAAHALVLVVGEKLATGRQLVGINGIVDEHFSRRVTDGGNQH